MTATTIELTGPSAQRSGEALRFECSTCGLPVRTAHSAAGRTGRCPWCAEETAAPEALGCGSERRAARCRRLGSAALLAIALALGVAALSSLRGGGLEVARGLIALAAPATCAGVCLSADPR